MSVQVINLTKSFGIQKAVDNISFTAEKGKILGFLGPNGAGKSTTMKVATSYLPPTEGTVLVCGVNVTTTPIESKKIIGYLPEHNPLYLDMYVYEYLNFIGGVHGIKGNHLDLRIKEMIELTGLTIEKNKKIGSLSKGYRQRVGLAQAMIHNPEVLILDEPTTGLDPNQIIEIREVIRQIGKEKTVIFSTHIMQEVQQLCDHVIIINKGKIVANQTIEDLKLGNQTTLIINVEFEKDINTTQIETLEGVLSIAHTGKGKYQLKATRDKDIRSIIFKLAAENQWPLIELKQEEGSLEQIFGELTK